jgi:predicted dehydrogenase
LEGVDRLQHLLAERRLFAMVGYMLRFHPLLRKVKAWLDEGPDGTLGQPVYVRASWGEHVPDWHPWEDYRTSYAARPELGGGPALTLSHELDLLVWMFGAPHRVLGLANRASPLEVECEHAIDMLMEFPSGLTANVHLDYFQRPPQRSWELVCSRGRVVFDYYAGTLRRFTAKIGAAPVEGKVVPLEDELFTVPAGFDRNEMFIEELKYFFACLESGRATSPGIAEACESVRICRAALNGDPVETAHNELTIS